MREVAERDRGRVSAGGNRLRAGLVSLRILTGCDLLEAGPDIAQHVARLVRPCDGGQDEQGNQYKEWSVPNRPRCAHAPPTQPEWQSAGASAAFPRPTPSPAPR